ncbi:MAG TPA: DUF5700 domain-containing putative Zn-dependent protease, partial [Candidatus Eisenbacteria bacterium]|nr:DUF5700 domain-containing putative Zn-dependent protease [Candidatus Eisenbacteria bacterium]
LAAAGSPNVHPHAVSDSVERAQWDRSMQRSGYDLLVLQTFFLDVLERRVSDPDSIRARAMEFFGVQGPWYTVGYRMAVTVERAQGRDALLASLCDAPRLLEAYNRSAPQDAELVLSDGRQIRAVWSERLLQLLAGMPVTTSPR